MIELIIVFWIVPSLVMAKVYTKDTLGFCALTFFLLTAWAIILSLFIGGTKIG